MRCSLYEKSRCSSVVEYFLGKEEVAGSSPVISTNNFRSIMAAKNDITGDTIQTRGASEAFRNNYDLIFRKKKVEEVSTEEYDVPLTRYNDETRHVKEKLSN